MNKITIIIGIVVVAVIAYFGFRSDAKITDTQIIKVGVSAPLTGIVADYGEEMRKGVEAASVSGVSFIFEDDKCEPKDAVSVFQKLTDIDKVSFIIGPACGSPQEAIVPLLSDKKVIAIVPAAASRNLFENSGGNLFNVQYSLEDESKFMADTLYQKGLKNVALVTYGNAFSKNHADSFKASFKGQILVDTVILDDNTNILTELTKVKSAKVDAIYVPDISFFFGGGMAKIQQLSMNTPIYTTYVAELPAVRTLVEGVIYSFPGDLEGAEGAIFNLSKQAAELLAPLIVECRGDTACVKEKITSSDKFDSFGTMIRPIILKQIKTGLPTTIQ